MSEAQYEYERARVLWILGGKLGKEPRRPKPPSPAERRTETP